MKFRIALFTLLVGLFISFFFFPVSEQNNITTKIKAKPADHKHEFNDYFFSVRNYPEEKPDIDAYLDQLSFQRSLIQNASRRTAEQIDWRLEGPQNIGGRVNTVATNPNNPDIMYAGAAKGGIFKTTDGGDNWIPVFDDQLLLSISKIVIDPQDENTIYAGTGDLNITQLPSIGEGLFKSTDAGATWQNIGLGETRIIADIKIHPNNSDIIYAGTMGLPYERNEDRGLYKTIDGGQNWEQVLYISDEAGVIDMEMDYNNPDILYAVGWPRIRNNTESTTWGLDAKIFKTTDGGNNWTTLAGGLPQTEFSRIGIAMSQQNPEKIYATYVDTTHRYHNTFVTNDGGDSWDAMENPYGIEPVSSFGWFFGQVRVNPVDDDIIYILGVDLYELSDNGNIWTLVTPEWWYYDVHADKHDLRFIDNQTMLLATDGGVYKGTEAFGGYWSWEDVEDIPISQFYRVAVSPHEEVTYAGGMQDNGTSAGNFSNINDWPRLNGGDGFTVQYHPTNPDLMWAETQRGNITLLNGYYGEGFNEGIDGDDRRGWDMPYIISKHDPDVFYTGTYRMYKTETGLNENWQPISEDLTDGQILADRYHTITAVNESSIDPNILMCGTVDSNVWITTDGGNNWINISAGLPERYVTSVKTSPINVNTVYVSQSGYKDNDNESHIFRSDDQGQTWLPIAGDLPNVPVNEILIYNDDENILFIATDAGVYISENAGQNWNFLGEGFPPVMTFDIEIDYPAHRIIAGTFARSLYSFPLNSIVSQADNTAPVITINGYTTITTVEGQNPDLPNVTAFDDVDGDITNLLVIENNVDINTPDTYTIIYTSTDSAGNSSTETITIIVEAEPPVLVIEGPTTITINQGEDFVLPTITANDGTDGDLTDEIVITNQVIPTNVPGTYVITVTVTDSNNNIVTENITVIVEPSVGIDDFKTHGISVFPNPVLNNLNIKFENEILKIEDLSIYNLNGSLMFNASDNIQLINIAALKSGIYTLRLTTNEGKILQEQIIKK